MLDRILMGSSAEASDPNFKNVTLLLHGDGSNGAQNNTFIDSSTNNFTITRNGNTTQGSFSPYGSNWSNYFDGTGDYLDVPSSTAFSFGTGDFTIEGWCYLSSNTGNYRVIVSIPHSSGWVQVRFGGIAEYNALFQVSVLSSAASNVYSTQTNQASALGRWMHFAFTRSSSTCRVFLDGVQQNLGTGTNPSSFPNASFSDSTNISNNNTIAIGNDIANSTFYIGNLSNLRIVKGTAVYTSNFTPSTTPLTAITNTSLLTCQSNRFIDNSTNNFTITRNGDVKVTNFSPFAPSAAYSTTTNGGSAYFDGTDDYLTVANSGNFDFGSGDFTVECWVYFNDIASNDGIVGVWGASGLGWILYREGGSYQFFYSGPSGSPMISSVGPVVGMWTHLAVTRSGTSLRFFVNGVNTATTNVSTTAITAYPSQNLGVAVNLAATSLSINGYMSDLRIVKGTAVYTSGFTPPTAPLSAVTNTNLLMKPTNAGIFDNSMKNDLETVGNAQISTSVKKFGTGSMAFDGSGDYLDTATNQVLAFGTGDFTIEGWLYTNSTTGDRNLVDFRPTGTNGAYPNIFIAGGGYLSYSANASVPITGGTVIATGAWYHFALARSGTSTKLFLNGTQQGSTYTDSTNYVVGDGRPRIGAGGYGAGVANFSGYIDDLRITKGIARYTANFTAPTAPFPNK